MKENEKRFTLASLKMGTEYTSKNFSIKWTQWGTEGYRLVLNRKGQPGIVITDEEALKLIEEANKEE